MRAWWTGAVLVAVGTAWWIADLVMTTLFPLSWGGPNIGAGLLLVLSLGVAVAGVLTLLAAGARLLARRPRPPVRVVVVPLALDAALLVALVAVRLLLPGDVGADGGLAGIDGQVGVTVDATGAPVLVLEVCHGSVDTISVVGPNRGSRPNEVFAELRTPQPVHVPTQVPLLAPPPGWTGAPTSLPLDSQDFLIASAQGRQSELLQVEFSASDLTALDPSTVQCSDDGGTSRDLVHRRAPRSGFHDLACARWATETAAD